MKEQWAAVKRPPSSWGFSVLLKDTMGESGDQTWNLVVTGRPLIPTELQLTQNLLMQLTSVHKPRALRTATFMCEPGIQLGDVVNKQLRRGRVDEFEMDPDVYLGLCDQCVGHLEQDMFNFFSSFIYILVGVVF